MTLTFKHELERVEARHTDTYSRSTGLAGHLK